MLVALGIYAKKMDPPSIILGGMGVHGKACWLIAYHGMCSDYIYCTCTM